MIRRIGTVVGHLLDDALHIEAQGQIAEGDNVIIDGHRITVGKICCEISGDTLSVDPGDRFCLPVNFNPDLVPAGTPVWLFSQKDTEVQPAGIVFHLYKKIEVLAVTTFEDLRLKQQVFLGDLGPFEISSIEINHGPCQFVLRYENCGLKLAGLDFQEATKKAKIYLVSEDGQPAEIGETVGV
jgi:hypothetical protein